MKENGRILSCRLRSEAEPNKKDEIILQICAANLPGSGNIGAYM